MHYNTIFEICQTGMSCKSEKVLNSGDLGEGQYTIGLDAVLQEPLSGCGVILTLLLNHV